MTATPEEIDNIRLVIRTILQDAYNQKQIKIGGIFESKQKKLNRFETMLWYIDLKLEELFTLLHFDAIKDGAFNPQYPPLESKR